MLEREAGSFRSGPAHGTGWGMLPPRYDARHRGEPALASEGPEQNEASLRAPALLLVGAAVGLALATFGILERRNTGQSMAEQTAARVGERTIRRIDYERVLAGVEDDLRNPIDDAMRRRVLDRMIDEELLVQRALDLGLAVVDRRVRGELTSGLIDSIVSEADAAEPSDRDVERHFEQNIDFFTRPGRTRAQTIFFSAHRDREHAGSSAAERAAEAAIRLAGGESERDLERLLGDPQVSPPPDVLLPASKLRDYVGPSLLRTLAGLEVDRWSEPTPSGGGLYLVRVIEREPPIVPRLDEVESLVRKDLKRRRGDQALRDYLDALRTQTPVAINERIFAPPPR